MKEIKIFALPLIAFIASCTGESCKIDYNSNLKLYEKAATEIYKQNYQWGSSEDYSRIIKRIRKEDGIVNEEVFSEIEFIECHEDSTLIFQAPNCDEQTDFKDEVYVLFYAPQGESHIKQKRNLLRIKVIKDGWYSGIHVRTLAN